MSFLTNQKAQSSVSSLDWLQPFRRITFSEIQLATRNFDESLVIGEGGFGKVYRGSITNGESLLDAAIKRLESTSNQGAEEFWAEVGMLSKLRHCHLVSLIGYCNDGDEMILVYEYMPNGTLADRLHKSRFSLTWVRRLKICIGAARGLDYLHTGTGINHGVIHRDVKSTNILLDDNWESKISDFGLSKIGPTNQPSTYVNTLVKGTFGYLDPNYFQTGRLTRKSDVYAFGVILFEVLCGKQAVDKSLDEEQWGLAPWAQDSIKEGMLKQIVDSKLKGTVSSKCMKQFAQLADRCLHSHPKRRPSMAEVVAGLESILALQEKTNKTLLPIDTIVFGRKVSAFPFPSIQGNSVVGVNLKSLELLLYSVGENRILRRFDYKTINVATENFSEANTISQDIFGFMHKGKLQNGQKVAIVGPYSHSKYELCMNELSILVKVEHENMVPLLGYCIEGENVYLLYDFAPNATLERLLDGKTEIILQLLRTYDDQRGLSFNEPSRYTWDWDSRYKVLVTVARVLLYLHKHAPIGIIHCDVKPRNVLLDESLNPRVFGFYFAISTAINENDYLQMDVIRGTVGYMAPEYCIHGHLSTKADVFRFGVLILKTLVGRSRYSIILETDQSLIDYVWRNWVDGTCSCIIDPRINEADLSYVIRVIHIGLWCIQYEATQRPTMEEVVGMLLGSSSIVLPVLKEPPGLTNTDFDISGEFYQND